jgi:hypothetical protein
MIRIEPFQMRYSLRRALSLDSVDGGTHNPTIRLWKNLAPHGSPSETDDTECTICLEGIAEHYIGALISHAGLGN